MIVLALIVLALLATRRSRTLGAEPDAPVRRFLLHRRRGRPSTQAAGAGHEADDGSAGARSRLPGPPASRESGDAGSLHVQWPVARVRGCHRSEPGGDASSRALASEGSYGPPVVMSSRPGSPRPYDYVFSLPRGPPSLRLRVMPGGWSATSWSGSSLAVRSSASVTEGLRPGSDEPGIKIAVWQKNSGVHSLDLALHRNRQSPQSRFVQLATIRENGRPAVRTLVFRGFLDDTHRLTFATDGRSEKVVEIEHSPWAEACWYFHLTREQFRFSGP